MRIDVTLEIGNSSETITVTDAAPLLKTESGELSHVVATARMDNLPVLQTGGNAGSSGIRNPITAVALIPGSALVVGQTGPTVRINGGQNNSQIMMVEGMDASNSLGQGASQQNQVGTDSVQEFAIQTSNYAAEFGQAGSAIMNITMKSGTNSFHGSLYEYFVHEELNAGQPLLNAINTNATRIANGNPRVKTRRNDYGFTLGGPVVIPELYMAGTRPSSLSVGSNTARGRTYSPTLSRVPTAAYRMGDFSAALGRTPLDLDPQGNTIFQNQIYDPATTTEVPSFKIDQVVGSKNKFSFSWNATRTNCDYCAGAEGLPLPVTSAIGTNFQCRMANP